MVQPQAVPQGAYFARAVRIQSPPGERFCPALWPRSLTPFFPTRRLKEVLPSGLRYRVMVMSDKRDYYEVLGVEKNASEGDLKNAFRSLARKYHPDRSTEDGAEDKFKEIQEAYAVLSDQEKRAQYDRFGHNGPWWFTVWWIWWRWGL